MNRHDAKTIISESVFVPSVILEAYMMDENQFVHVAARLAVFFRAHVKKEKKSEGWHSSLKCISGHKARELFQK